MKVVIPAIINPPRIRKDKSLSVSFDTREMNATEMMTLLSLSGSEGWLAFSPNQEELVIPDEQAEVEGKSVSQRIRSALYVLYKKRTEKGEHVGLFDSFYNNQQEKYLEFIKSKIND